MLHRRAMLRTALAVASATTLARANSPLSLREVIERHTRARGGTTALDSVYSMRTALLISEQGSTLMARYGASIALGERMRIDVFASGARVWSEGLDSGGAWAWPAKDAAPHNSEAGAAALAHGIVFNLYGLHRIPDLGGRLVLSPAETIANITYFVVAATLADGFATIFYIDPTSWMIVRRRDVRPIHPDLDPTAKPMENDFWDFRPVEGVQTSFQSSQIDLSRGIAVQATEVTDLTYNNMHDVRALERSAPSL